MTKLFDPRTVKKIELPSFPGSEVELYDGLLTQQAIEINKKDDDYDIGMNMLQYIIKSWSFVDENEKPLPITRETLGMLPMKDFSMLMNEVEKTMDFLGKKEMKS
jgi:hypothetical protein